MELGRDADGTRAPVREQRGAEGGLVPEVTTAGIMAHAVQPTVPEADRVVVLRRAASRGSLKVALFSRRGKGPSRMAA
jgi:hypothetical protein